MLGLKREGVFGAGPPSLGRPCGEVPRFCAAGATFALGSVLTIPIRVSDGYITGFFSENTRRVLKAPLGLNTSHQRLKAGAAL